MQVRPLHRLDLQIRWLDRRTPAGHCFRFPENTRTSCCWMPKHWASKVLHRAIPVAIPAQTTMEMWPAALETHGGSLLRRPKAACGTGPERPCAENSDANSPHFQNAESKGEDLCNAVAEKSCGNCSDSRLTLGWRESSDGTGVPVQGQIG